MSKSIHATVLILSLWFTVSCIGCIICELAHLQENARQANRKGHSPVKYHITFELQNSDASRVVF